MVYSLGNKSSVPSGVELILYNYELQEAKQWRECPNKIIAAEPLSWCKPKEESDVVDGNGSASKRKRCTFFELEVEKEKKFSLQELYKSNDINEILKNNEKSETTLDPRELMKNLEWWTVKKRQRQEKNGNVKVDKIYRHPKSKRVLRSLVEVKKFIEENSYLLKAADNSDQGGTGDSQSNIYLQLFQCFEETLNSGTKQTCNNSSKKGSSSSWSEQRDTFKSTDTVDLRLHSDTVNEVRQSEQSDSSKKQVSSDQMRSRDCVTAFGVELSHCDHVFGACSSSVNITSLDEIKMMVQSQVEAQLHARVAKDVAEKVSHYEKTQREMIEKLETMHRLLLHGGLLSPPPFPKHGDLGQVVKKDTFEA